MNIVNVGYDSTNYYLLALGQTYLMVDAGWPKTLPKLENACKRKGLALKQIEYVLVTHYHPDHAGLVHELTGLGSRLLVPENQRSAAPASSGNVDLSFAESRSFLQKIGLPGELIPTPGHSDDSVTLVLDEGLAFTGDLGPALDGGPNEATLESWKRIRALGAKSIYPGHGPVRPIG